MTKNLLLQNSLTNVGFNAYTEYLAIKRHFDSVSYDYHKYNGKVNASFDSFTSRKDAFTFQRLGKQKDFSGLILSNIIAKPKVWVGELLDDAAKEIYTSWKVKQNAITFHLQSSLSTLKDDFQSNFIVRNGSYPYLLDLIMQKKISFEVFTILVAMTNTRQYWLDSISDKFIAPDVLKKADKYYPFLNLDQQKIKKVVKDRFF